MTKRIIILLLLLFNISVFSQPKSVLAKSFYAKAEKEFEAKNYNSSLKMLDKAKEYLEGETYPKIEYLYVMNHFKLRNYYKADVHLKKYFSLNPSDDSSMYAEILEVLPDIKTKARKNKAVHEINVLFRKVGTFKKRKKYEYKGFEVSEDGNYLLWEALVIKSGNKAKYRLKLNQPFKITTKEYEDYDIVSLRLYNDSSKIEFKSRFKKKGENSYKYWKTKFRNEVFLFFSTDQHFIEEVKEKLENLKLEL